MSTIPLGRPCEPKDVANACCYLASDEAEFITGVNLEVCRVYFAAIQLECPKNCKDIGKDRHGIFFGGVFVLVSCANI